MPNCWCVGAQSGGEPSRRAGTVRERLVKEEGGGAAANEECPTRDSVWKSSHLSHVGPSVPHIPQPRMPLCEVLPVGSVIGIIFGWLCVLSRCKLKPKTASFKWIGSRACWWMYRSKSRHRSYTQRSCADDLKCLQGSLTKICCKESLASWSLSPL